MPIKKQGSQYVLTSPNSGKKLYSAPTKAAVVKRAKEIAYFRSH